MEVDLGYGGLVIYLEGREVWWCGYSDIMKKVSCCQARIGFIFGKEEDMMSVFGCIHMYIMWMGDEGLECDMEILRIDHCYWYFLCTILKTYFLWIFTSVDLL